MFEPPPDKSFLRLWNKNFVTEIYRKSSFWAFRNGALQMFYLTPNQTHVCWKTCKVSKTFGCVTGYIFYNVKLVEVCKMSEVFRAKLYCKMSYLFASFCWFWDFLPETLKWIKSKIWDFESFIWWSNFLGLF